MPLEIGLLDNQDNKSCSYDAIHLINLKTKEELFFLPALPFLMSFQHSLLSLFSLAEKLFTSFYTNILCLDISALGPSSNSDI